MGLLDNTTQNEYYNGNDLGNYQFTSLDNIISQFEVAYVGENKIIPKIKRADIAFHAMRALQELSFDTFKSIKSQQIDVPASLTMALPHDYVNYTKLSWADSAGIKHPLYPTNSTSNPFEVKQNDDGTYFFGEYINIVKENNLATIDEWNVSTPQNSDAWSDTYQNTNQTLYFKEYIADTISIVAQQLEFGMLWLGNNAWNSLGGSRAYGAWQELDVTTSENVDLVAAATSGAQQTDGSGNLLCDYGIVRIGISTVDPGLGWTLASGKVVTANHTHPDNTIYPTPNNDPSRLDLGYVEWVTGDSGEKQLMEIDVSSFDKVWIYIQTESPWTAAGVTLDDGGASGGATAIDPLVSVNNTHQKNTVDNVQVYVSGVNPNLSHADINNNSSTWNNYKSGTPSENQDDYVDDTYWPYDGRRYGLEPSHAQANGSFYIDQILGKIHFSSNISGKTVILDYISDSLGTDKEMQVHKFAEDAMYKYIAHAILSTSSYGQPLVPRLIKEKFAAIRKAKLRLSSLKIEELTQILRGKSKQIKH
jgi:hypothetical protein